MFLPQEWSTWGWFTITLLALVVDGGHQWGMFHGNVQTGDGIALWFFQLQSLGHHWTKWPLKWEIHRSTWWITSSCLWIFQHPNIGIWPRFKILHMWMIKYGNWQELIGIIGDEHGATAAKLGYETAICGGYIEQTMRTPPCVDSTHPTVTLGGWLSKIFQKPPNGKNQIH